MVCVNKSTSGFPLVYIGKGIALGPLAPLVMVISSGYSHTPGEAISLSCSYSPYFWPVCCTVNPLAQCYINPKVTVVGARGQGTFGGLSDYIWKGGYMYFK